MRGRSKAEEGGSDLIRRLKGTRKVRRRRRDLAQFRRMIRVTYHGRISLPRIVPDEEHAQQRADGRRDEAGAYDVRVVARTRGVDGPTQAKTRSLGEVERADERTGDEEGEQVSRAE